MNDLRPLFPYLRPYRRIYIIGFTLVAASNLFVAAGPWFLERGIDAIRGGASFGDVQRAALLIVAVAVVAGVARFGMRQTLNAGSRRVEADVREVLYRHLQRMSAEFYDRFPIGDVMARTTNDLLAVRMVAGPALMYIVDTLARALLIIPLMVAINPRLALFALLPLAALPVAIITLGQMIHRRTTAIQAQFSDLTSHVHEHLSGIRVVRAYRQEEAETGHFRALNESYAVKNLQLARVQGAFYPLFSLLGGMSAGIVLYVGGRLLVAGTITIGEFVAFGVYLAMFVWPMIALGWAISLIQRGAASMARINQLFAQRPAIADPAVPAALPPATHGREVEFRGVRFRYPAAPERGWILQDVSFRVPAGRSLAIVGATGSGKSTLVELLTRAYDPDEGAILLDGVDIRTLPLEELRRELGFVPQETFLFSETVRQNVLLGAPDDGRLEEVATIAQLTEALPALPQGYDTLLGERGINLSGGQKQRTAIARALAQDPPVFVLDDALSAVDAHTEAQILMGLRDALRRRTSLIVSHRLGAVRDADGIIVLDEGRIVEQGTHAELIGHGGRYWELVRRQQLEEALEDAPK